MSADFFMTTSNTNWRRELYETAIGKADCSLHSRCFSKIRLSIGFLRSSIRGCLLSFVLFFDTEDSSEEA